MLMPKGINRCYTKLHTDPIYAMPCALAISYPNCPIPVPSDDLLHAVCPEPMICDCGMLWWLNDHHVPNGEPAVPMQECRACAAGEHGMCAGMLTDAEMPEGGGQPSHLQGTFYDAELVSASALWR